MAINQGTGGASPWAIRERSSKATVKSVTSATADTLLCAENTKRTGLSIYNDSTQILYVKCGTQASSSSFTVQMASEDYYEMPFGYQGPVYGAWAAANGTAMVTEFTE